jgi:hypothetical protein
MIRYTLKCAKDHDFDSWFASAAAFGTLLDHRQVTCPTCGTDRVAKALMAPSVRPARLAADPKPGQGTLSQPQSDVEAALAEMRRKVETTSDYVGVNFVAEARKMHSGEVPERSIYGEAKLDQVKSLLEEGVPIAPLPFMPPRRTN